MIKNKVILLLLGILVLKPSFSQTTEMPEALKQAVIAGNPVLNSANYKTEAGKMESRTGITPSDPVLELGFLRGQPGTLGNRVDFSVGQEFAFPASYFQEIKKADLQGEILQLLFEMERQGQLSRARALWIDIISLQKKGDMIKERLTLSTQLKEQYEKMLHRGEIGRLALNQVNLQETNLQLALQEVENNLQITMNKLNEACGGQLPELDYSEFPLLQNLNIDSLYTAYEKGFEMQWYQQQKDMKEIDRKLAISKGLPKFSAGYYSESVLDEQFRGIHMGMSLPLWENKNVLKQQVVEINYATAELDRYKLEMESYLLRLFERMESLEKQKMKLGEALKIGNDLELLQLALEMGEISLSEYIYSSDYYFNNMLKLHELESKIFLTENELLKIFL